jgi:hypothetical protein
MEVPCSRQGRERWRKPGGRPWTLSRLQTELGLELADEVGTFGGQVLRTSLSRQAEADRQAALEQHHAGAHR